MIEINNFLSDYPSFRHACDLLSYDGMENPADGVFYPGVTIDISDDIKREVQAGLELALGKEIKINVMFLRMSKEGVEVPHMVHTDTIMGRYSFMLYLNREEDCEGGTALVQHENGMYREPSCSHSLKVWQDDYQNIDKWTVTKMCDMKENKGCIFDARLMHMAFPVGGFGDSVKNGRLVLTAFFDEV